MSLNQSLSGISVDSVIKRITDTGIADHDAALIVSGWIFENYGRTRRTFNFAQSFPSTMEACMPPAFVRAFVHQDWTDGEDVVQAGETVNDEGFNSRFHKI